MFACNYKTSTQKYICLVAVVLLGLPALLQAQQYNFRNWGLEHGLPQSQVTDIIQDNMGQLWLATTGGLSQFNGSSFQNYTSKHGLPHNRIKCLFQDSRGHIWIGSSGGGVAVFKGGTTLKPASGEIDLKAGNVHDIAEDKAGRIWLATDSGMFYFNNHTFRRHEKFPAQLYSAVLCSPSDDVWAGSAQGLYLARKNSVTLYSQQNGLPSDNITCLMEDKAGGIWVGTDKGVARFVQGVLNLLELPAYISSPAVAGLAQDKDNNIWIAFQNCGLLKYDGKNFTHITRNNGLKTNKIASLATDREGNVWIGTAGHGLQQYKNPFFVHYFDFEQLNEPKITALSKDDSGRLWLGSDNGQVAYQENGEFHWLQQNYWPEGTTIHHIRAQKENEAWLCTSSGLWSVNSHQYTRYSTQEGLPAEEVFYCATAEDGTLWLATAKGVAYLKDGKFTTIPGSDTGKAYTLLLDQQRQMWLGAENGVFTVSKNGIAAVSALRRFNLTDVKTIAEDAAGNLYFGGFANGLLRLDKSRNKATLYSSKHGLPQESFQSLFVDYSDNLWVGTSTSVLKIPLESLRRENKINSRSYNYHNGFRGIEVGRNTITQTPDSAVWFGTAKGITRYNQTLDRRNTVYSIPMLTSIQLFMQPTDWDGLGFATDTLSGLPISLRLLHNQNHITFNFQGICMTEPDEVRYKYRLNGHSDEWSGEAKQPFITFANLDPGSYTFELLTRNNDGYWSPSPLTYAFSIAPPIWRREWFLGLLLALLVASVVSVVRLREKSLVKLNLLLEQKVRHRTLMLEEKNKEKETLLKEVHHRVKNNLQIVISMLNQQVRHTFSAEATEVMSAVRNRVRSMALLHESLYQQSDLGQIDLHNYFAQICDNLYASFGVCKEKIELGIAVPHTKVDTDSAITLGLIVNELVSNALKYAFPDGQHGLLRIVMDCHDNHTYTLTVSDNGIGFQDKEAQQQHPTFGLQLVHSLIKKLKGKAEFKNCKGTTAILTFNLPS